MECREKILLNSGWRTWLGDRPDGMCLQADEQSWKTVQVPHNWEDYQGYRKQSHGNLHGTAWYHNRFSIKERKTDEHVFVYFEGVGSYADVYLNQGFLGRHEGGLTGFCLEMTRLLREGENLLAVRADHPAAIQDLPWVCGGCFGTPNSEGSQPFGIHRGVSLYTTGKVRLVPFGVGILPTGIKEGHPAVRIHTELENLEQQEVTVTLHSIIRDPQGTVIEKLAETISLGAGELLTARQNSEKIADPQLWSPETPVLYQVETVIIIDGAVSDRVTNSFGLRYIQWENFEGSGDIFVDREKALAQPGDENQFFCTYTRGSADSKVGVIPGGVHVTLPADAPEKTVILLETTVTNRDSEAHRVFVESFVQTYNATKSIANLKTEVFLAPGETRTVAQETGELHYLDQWTPEQPLLHGVYTTIRETSDSLKEYNQTYTSFGICQTRGLANKGYAYVEQQRDQGNIRHRFLLNGKHVFLNGTAEYQHLLGNDHAFWPEQIETRVKQIKAAGFNAFREAHCPHDLGYLDLCDRMGILYWAQMGAHLYFDNEKFHHNFIKLTEEFVRERRNSPSLILWGIQNESLLPAVFADQVRQLIRSLDDTASQERMVTTCNGGSGSDWNVPQNWCGTYGGSVLDYQEGFRKQLLVGEYGQYRVIGKHQEGDCESGQNAGGDVSEELFCYCMETKVRLAGQIREEVYGHYQWIFNAHANPGRETVFCLDGSGIDSVGVINSKGLLTSWGEPVDGFYMYRSHFAPAQTEPMVYLVSHTWPDRFQSPGQKADIIVYSNCEEVELIHGLNGKSCGRLKRGAVGEHFTFRDVQVSCNILTAVGYVDGTPAARDRIWLQNLPEAEGLSALIGAQPDPLWPEAGNYLYRINCGGDTYTDQNGSVWEADRMYTPGGYGWTSWAMEYEEIDPGLGSRRISADLIGGTRDPQLFQSYRYGREKLVYTFPVPNDDYTIELFFIEPWYGVGGGMDCTGWRLFDVAVNDTVVLKQVDIWKEAGVHMAWKQTIPVTVENGMIRITFPHTASYQAVISAIAISRAF